METNENSFTLRMSDGPVETPTPFANVEAMDTSPADISLPLNNDESIKKVVDAEPESILEKENAVEVKEIVNKVEENEHDVLNNKEEMKCDGDGDGDGQEAPVESDVISHSSLNNSDDPVHNECAEEKVDSVMESVEDKKEEKVEGENEEGHEAEPQPVAQKEQVRPQTTQDAVEPPPQPHPHPHPTPALEEEEEEVITNDVEHSEDETKVEEVSGSDEMHQDKVEESTTEPLVEEPHDVEMKEEVDGHVEEEKKHDDSKQHVEISDVTDKEQEQVEQEKKSDEELLMDHINSAYQCLDDFMQTKDEIKIKDCMDLLTEIKTLTVKTVDTLKVFTAEQQAKEEVHTSKKGKRSKSTTKTPKSASRAEKNDVGIDTDSPDPFEKVNLKDIKGLAVFAKWPNSGWFYPGVVRDLALADLKGNQNLTVTFYDGLERDMKSINIFPAQLIPASSILFDLDEETDLTLTSIEREDNWVKYVLTMAGDDQQVTKDFDKMAIKGAHMKTIKQAVDSQANKSEIVTGRRARGKSSMFSEDYVSSSSPRTSEKRKSKVVEDSKSTPVKAPAKRKSSSKDDESGDSTPSRSANKRRQVNGSKSMPRRAAKK